MDIATLFQKFALALGLGLLIGMQRERASSDVAGFRTFPLVTMLGTLCGSALDHSRLVRDCGRNDRARWVGGDQQRGQDSRGSKSIRA